MCGLMILLCHLFIIIAPFYLNIFISCIVIIILGSKLRIGLGYRLANTSATNVSLYAYVGQSQPIVNNNNNNI